MMVPESLSFSLAWLEGLTPATLLAIASRSHWLVGNNLHRFPFLSFTVSVAMLLLMT